MKTLLLLRHAKSSWKDPGKEDFDRTLNKRGRREAAALGCWMGANGLWPDLALCSDAARARETWQAAMEAGGAQVKTDWRHDLYLAEPNEILSAIQAVPGNYDRTIIIGHNPGIGALAEGLCGTATRSRLTTLKGFPTAAYAEYDFEVDDWNAVGPGNGICVRADTAKEIAKREDRS